LGSKKAVPLQSPPWFLIRFVRLRRQEFAIGSPIDPLIVLPFLADKKALFFSCAGLTREFGGKDFLDSKFWVLGGYFCRFLDLWSDDPGLS
jgi:hypothetical protein